MIPHWGTKMPQAAWHGQKSKSKRKKKDNCGLTAKARTAFAGCIRASSTRCQGVLSTSSTRPQEEMMENLSSDPIRTLPSNTRTGRTLRLDQTLQMRQVEQACSPVDSLRLPFIKACGI